MRLVGKPDPRDGWYEIDVASATDILNNGLKNRPLKTQIYKDYSEAIRRGQWVENGEPIIFDHNGRLADGQQRLRGVQVAGKPIITYVIHLLEDHNVPAAFDSMNSGAKRTASDRLSIIGVPNYAMCASTVAKVLNYELSDGPRSMRAQHGVTSRAIRLRYQSDKDAFDRAVSIVAAHAKEIRGWLRPSTLAFVHYMASKIDSGKAERFVLGVATGENLAGTNPALVVRKRLMDQAMSKTSLPPVEYIALLIKAWTAFKKQKTTKIIKWDSREAFPRFED